MQRSTQRLIVDAGSVVLPKPSSTSLSTSSAAEVTTLKANVVAKSKLTMKKRRIHVKDGRSYVLAIDQHTIRRTSITIVASLCCFVAYRSLTNEVNEIVERHALKSQSVRRQQKQLYERTSNDELTKGKERILQLLNEAGIIELDDNTLSRLPTWEEVMYVCCNH